MVPERNPRVILWGPGQVGIGALRAVIAHPGLDLTGLVVHNPAKAGRDAGELCGMPDTGVLATTDAGAALATEADVVAYFASGDYRYREAAEDIAACLRAGKNVVTTSLVPLCYPPAADRETVELLEQACTEGQTSLFNSGVDPGWANDLSCCRWIWPDRRNPTGRLCKAHTAIRPPPEPTWPPAVPAGSTWPAPS